MNNTEDQIYAMRHSLAHIMANAIQHLWPAARFGIGPVVENGFYYDVDIDEHALSEEDFPDIEKEMGRIIDADEQFERFEMNIADAVEWANNNNQPYKLELLNDLWRSGTTKREFLEENELGVSTTNSTKISTVSFYRNGDFTDLCRGPHVNTTGSVGFFKLMRVSGAYWRGDIKKPQMQRIYGVAFRTQMELKEHLSQLEEAKNRDHRKLGAELDLFTISELVGAGLPLFTPRGTVLRDNLSDYSQALQAKYGFERVWTPHMARTELYKVSGHYDKYPERFEVTSSESSDVFMMKPMNCPHHIQLFSRRQWSYKELPVRYMENTTNYRDEKSGELHGLSRVRSLSQDDGHIFCKRSDIENELASIVRMVKELYQTLDMEFFARLSFRDQTDKYLGDKRLWKRAETVIVDVAKKEKLTYEIGEGEAAFYGPKIDFMVKDSLNREWQCATIQLDFILPHRFKLTYVDENGSIQTPVMIHKALLGSIERFLSVYIEHTAGRFPVWLAPEQVRLITVNQEPETLDFAQKIYDIATEKHFRFNIDNANESVGKKIRNAEMQKIPYVIVVGEKEINTNKFTPRIRKDLMGENSDASELTIEAFIDCLEYEVKSRISKTTVK